MLDEGLELVEVFLVVFDIIDHDRDIFVLKFYLDVLFLESVGLFVEELHEIIHVLSQNNALFVSVLAGDGN